MRLAFLAKRIVQRRGVQKCRINVQTLQPRLLIFAFTMKLRGLPIVPGKLAVSVPKVTAGQP